MKNYYDVIDGLNAIESMCKIALKHASKKARNEVVGHYSGRTIEDLFLGIHGICREIKDGE